MYYTFKFKREQVEDSWVLRPKIKVTLKYKEKSRDVTAILDTGSDLNYLPPEVVDYFELPLSEKVFDAQGAEQEFSYKTSKIYAILEHPHKSFRKLINIMVPVKNAIHKDIIFGTDFLQNFIVNLDYAKGTIRLSENPSSNKKKAKYFH
jgi:hypothetical protein